jgi:hypothetical protein
MYRVNNFGLPSRRLRRATPDVEADARVVKKAVLGLETPD